MTVGFNIQSSNPLVLTGSCVALNCRAWYHEFLELAGSQSISTNTVLWILLFTSKMTTNVYFYMWFQRVVAHLRGVFRTQSNI